MLPCRRASWEPMKKQSFVELRLSCFLESVRFSGTDKLQYILGDLSNPSLIEGVQKSSTLLFDVIPIFTLRIQTDQICGRLAGCCPGSGSTWYWARFYISTLSSVGPRWNCATSASHVFTVVRRFGCMANTHPVPVCSHSLSTELHTCTL